MLAAKGNFKEAVPELEEDQDNPETLVLLARAYKETGATDKSRATEERLRTTNLPTLEQALASGAITGQGGSPAIRWRQSNRSRRLSSASPLGRQNAVHFRGNL